MSEDLQAIHCPGCGHRIEVAPGSKLACPGCGQHIVIECAALPVAAQPPAPHAPPRSTIGVSKPPVFPKWVWEWVRAVMIAGLILCAFGLLYLFVTSVGKSVGGEAVVMVLLICLYFAPTVSAIFSGHPHAAGIGIVNIFLGWTLVGWVAAAAWAATAPRRQR